MQKVVLTNNGLETDRFFVPEFMTAQNSVINHLSKDRRHRATIHDEITGDFRVYFWIGDKLNVSVF